MEMARLNGSGSTTPSLAFQLGHVFSDMEILKTEGFYAGYDAKAFQLGHVFSDMEILRSPTACSVAM